MRIEAIADIHVGLDNQGHYKEHFSRISERADALVIAGDLTQTGTIDEAEILKLELSALTVPCICVLGNHDYDRNLQNEIAHILSTGQIVVLEGTHKMIRDVGIAGIKGSIGGFGNKMIPPFGEQLFKDIVNATNQEALELERALSLIETNKKIVVMHYSPIRETVIGEDPEIFPFLGSTRFEEVINRMNATVVFHGHAHQGTLEGKTQTGISVFNVSRPVLERNKNKFFVYEV
jgi:Icc-related predicted phosphoesterase